MFRVLCVTWLGIFVKPQQKGSLNKDHTLDTFDSWKLSRFSGDEGIPSLPFGTQALSLLPLTWDD